MIGFNQVTGGLSFLDCGGVWLALALPHSGILSKFSEFRKVLQTQDYSCNITIRTAVLIQKMKGRVCVSKDEYIERIVELLRRCNDIPLIDLIFRLLRKSV